MAKIFSRLGSVANSLLLALLILALNSSFYAGYTIPKSASYIVASNTTPKLIISNTSLDNVLEIPAKTDTTAEDIKIIKSAPPTGIGDEYLALGDSVAYGVGAPTPYEMGYAGLFYSKYLQRVQPHLNNYKNFGIPGETSHSFLENANPQALSQYQRALNEIDAAKAAHRRISPITLTIGGNDMLDARNTSQENKNAALAKYTANLQQILAGLQAHTEGHSDIIVTTYFNPFGNPSGADDDANWVQRFNEVIKQTAQQQAVATADFYTPILGDERNLTWSSYGDVHPNRLGYTKLALALWQATKYDTVAPTLNMIYSSLPKTGSVMSGQRFSFKLEIQDNWDVTDLTTLGAGSITNATVIIDSGDSQDLAAVPARFVSGPPASQQFTFILNTTSLNTGTHILHFRASDAAGNNQTLDLSFEIA
jgi:lysophospholipase L1-like esterase